MICLKIKVEEKKADQKTKEETHQILHLIKVKEGEIKECAGRAEISLVLGPVRECVCVCVYDTQFSGRVHTPIAGRRPTRSPKLPLIQEI